MILKDDHIKRYMSMTVLTKDYKKMYNRSYLQVSSVQINGGGKDFTIMSGSDNGSE